MLPKKPNTPFQWASASLSDVGLVRSINEDACVELPQAGVWLVADGMGGHEGGAIASRAVVDAVAEIKPTEHLSILIGLLHERLQYANQLLRAESRRRNGNIIGTTFAALVLHGRHCVSIWMGDSRIYRVRKGELLQLTHDHRWVEEYVTLGLMTRELADRHPLAHELTRAVGAEDSIKPSIVIRELAAADRFLLCSDGLYGELSDQEILPLLANEDLNQACHAMVEKALKNGAHDNVSVVAVQVMKAS